MLKTVRAEKIFTGTDWLYHQQIVVEDGIVKDLHPLTENLFIKEEAAHFLAPGFVDFQVYGAAGKLFSAYPSAETLHTLHKVLAAEGTCLFQPTLASNTIAVFKQAIDAVRHYWRDGGRGVHGLHLEGPWIHPAKRGAHIESVIHPPTMEEVEALLAYGKGVIKTITLAPEVCSRQVIDRIREDNIVVAAGHSNAGFAEATAAFENGVATVTHLFNAMQPLHHREPGLIGAALLHKEVTASIIPDGHHVNFSMIGLAKQLMGQRLFAITDAVTDTTEGAYRHQRVGDKYECNGTLSGSALSMYQCFYRLVKEVGIDIAEALRMCALYPARVMGAEHLYGKIAPGFAAQFVVLDKQLKLVEVLT